MNTNLTTNDMNIEDYEDQAIKKSRLAKGIGIAVGGAAVAAGTTYAATTSGNDVLDEPVSADEMAQGAEIGDEIEPVEETPETQTTQYIYVEKSAPEPEEEKASDMTWDETTNYYIGDEKVMSIQEGTLEGHDFMLIDSDADGQADVLAYDVNNNHQYEQDEILKLTPEDNISMANQTAHTSDYHYDPWFGQNSTSEDQYAYEEDGPNLIHNNFEDEKTGEDYHGDFAEDNPDYNPYADLDYGSNDQYLAEDYRYDGGEYGIYHAGLNETEIEDNVAPQPDMADMSGMEDESFDSMMESEEFLG